MEINSLSFLINDDGGTNWKRLSLSHRTDGQQMLGGMSVPGNAFVPGAGFLIRGLNQVKKEAKQKRAADEHRSAN